MKLSSYRGCLLGLAVGDAMGYAVDSRTLREIQEDYGPNGLRGYDLVNGYAEITSHTQLAAFACNGLLVGLTRGQMTGRMAPFVHYVGQACWEWTTTQRAFPRSSPTVCWLTRQKSLCHHHCMDTRILETLNRDVMGTLEDPINNYAEPGGLTTAVGVGLFFDRKRAKQPEIDRLGAEAVALTHGSPTAFLSGAILAHIISLCLRRPDAPLKAMVKHAMEAVREQFGHQYSQTYEICNLLRYALVYGESPNLKSVDVMEKLGCKNSAQVLAGAIYACLASGEDFDRAMIIAVNHSGRSAAVGAVAGAILGARMGEETLPDFYVESLEPAAVLRELAFDLHQGCPMEKGSRLFDGDWVQKYLHGGR